MSDARLDLVLAEGSTRVGRSDPIATEEVACCVEYTRKGTAKTFGTAADGLDTIDDGTELNAVLNNASARMKVVRAINYCGGPGTNIIGCAWVGGYGAGQRRQLSCGPELRPARQRRRRHRRRVRRRLRQRRARRRREL